MKKKGKPVVSGIWVGDHISITSTSRRGNDRLIMLFQTFLLFTGISSLLFCVISGLGLMVSVPALLTGIMIICGVYIILFCFGRLLHITFPITFVLYLFVVYYYRDLTANGFYHIENAVIERFNEYTNSSVSGFLTSLNELESTTCFLLVAAGILIPIFSWTIVRGIMKSLYTVLCLALLSLSFLLGRVPGPFALLFFSIHFLAVMVMNRVPMGINARTVLQPYDEVRPQNSFKHKIRMKAGMFCAVFMLFLFLVIGLIFPKSIYDKYVDMTSFKTSLQDAMYKISFEDMFHGLDDWWKDFTGGSFNPFKSTASGGLDGGRLNLEDKVEFTYETAMKVTVPRHCATLYLKGYAGSGYSGTNWEELSREDEERYQKILDDYGKGIYNGNSLPSQLLDLIHAKILEVNGQVSNSGSSDVEFNFFTKNEISLEYENANKKFLYIPYDTKKPGSETAYEEADLYMAPEERKADYTLTYYDMYENLSEMLLDSVRYGEEGLVPYFVSDKKDPYWKDFFEFERAYRDFVYDVYTRMPEQGLLQLKGLKLNVREDTISKINAVKAYLKNDTSYTLNPGELPAGADYVEHFLFSSKKGYCAHYASAAVLLLRNLGVPARYVEGYMVSSRDIATAAINGRGLQETINFQGTGEKREVEQATVNVRDSNAHAWVEVYLNGYGWYPVEVTTGFLADPYFEEESDLRDPVLLPTEAPTEAETEAEAPEKEPQATKKPEQDPVPTEPIELQNKAEGDFLHRFLLPVLLAILLALLLLAAAFMILLLRKKLADRKRNISWQSGPFEKRILSRYQEILRILEEVCIPGLYSNSLEDSLDKTEEKLCEMGWLKPDRLLYRKAAKAAWRARFGELPDMDLQREDETAVDQCYQEFHKKLYEGAMKKKSFFYRYWKNI